VSAGNVIGRVYSHQYVRARQLWFRCVRCGN